MSNLSILTGFIQGRLTVIGPSESRFHTGRKRVFWFCQCSCGNTKWIQSDNLKFGKTLSCGCYKAELLRKGKTTVANLRKTGWEPHRTHGKTNTKVYRTWCRIKARCFCPTDISFQFYGALGITMCDEWRNSFAAFYAHVGDPPSDETSIDRKDNSRGYEPGNVRWATRLEQCNNRRKTVRYEGQTIMELSHKYQVHYERLKYLLRQRKLTLKEALHQCQIPI